MSDYPCCEHCDHDPGYKHAGLCLVCGQVKPVVIVMDGIELELS